MENLIKVILGRLSGSRNRLCVCLVDSTRWSFCRLGRRLGISRNYSRFSGLDGS